MLSTNQNYIHYIASILIWGTTWYVIKFQLGVVPLELSVAYRFCGASLILILWSYFNKKSLRFSKHDHLILFLKGICLYSLSYWCAYFATQYIPSGIIALLFSSVIIFNIINAHLFFRQKVSFTVLGGALIGLSGLLLIFWPEVKNTSFHFNSLLGMAVATLGGFIASLGNMASLSSQKRGVSIVAANAISMGYGSLVSFLIAFSLGYPVVFDTSASYLLSLFYLTIFGSIIAFGCYLTLLGRIGPDRAAYPLVLIPVIALMISAVFESYEWNVFSVMGVGLILFGNYLVTFFKSQPKKNLTLSKTEHNIKEATSAVSSKP